MRLCVGNDEPCTCAFHARNYSAVIYPGALTHSDITSMQIIEDTQDRVNAIVAASVEAMRTGVAARPTDDLIKLLEGIIEYEDITHVPLRSDTRAKAGGKMPHTKRKVRATQPLAASTVKLPVLDMSGSVPVYTKRDWKRAKASFSKISRRMAKRWPGLCMMLDQMRLDAERGDDTPDTRSSVTHEKYLGEDKLIRALEVVKFLRTMPGSDTYFYIQEEMLNILLAAALPLIVGQSNFQRHLPRYLSILGVNKSTSQTMLIEPRQMGKTQTVAMVACVLLICCPGAKILCCAPAKEQAREVLNRARSLYMQLPDEYRVPLIKNSADMMVVEHSPGVETKVEVRAANTKTTRGVAPDYVIVDEFEFIDAKFYKQVILPLFVKSGRIFTSITTPGAPSSEIVDIRKSMEDDQAAGNQYVSVYDYSMICNQCRQDGTTDMCAHGLYKMPPWKNVYSVIQLKRLFGRGGETDYIQELYGESMSPTNRVFSENACKRKFSDQNMVDLQPDPNNLRILTCTYPPTLSSHVCACVRVLGTGSLADGRGWPFPFVQLSIRAGAAGARWESCPGYETCMAG